MEKDLQNLEWLYMDKEAQLERELGESVLQRQNQQVIDLKQRQLAEKQRAFTNFLPESTLKQLMLQLSAEEEAELKKFREEMEAEKLRKMAELDEKRRKVLEEMEAQRRRLEKLERINREMESEEQRRKREAEKERKRLQMMKNAGTIDQDQVDRLLKEHEHNTRILHTVFQKERQRQLDLMAENKDRIAQLREEQRKEAERKAQEEEERRRQEASLEAEK